MLNTIVIEEKVLFMIVIILTITREAQKGIEKIAKFWNVIFEIYKLLK